MDYISGIEEQLKKYKDCVDGVQAGATATIGKVHTIFGGSKTLAEVTGTLLELATAGGVGYATGGFAILAGATFSEAVAAGAIIGLGVYYANKLIGLPVGELLDKILDTTLSAIEDQIEKKKDREKEKCADLLH